jgi:hypothetical protein
MEYAGFWKRFGDFWLDFIMLIPIMAFAIREVESHVWIRAMIAEYKDIKKKSGLS